MESGSGAVVEQVAAPIAATAVVQAEAPESGAKGDATEAEAPKPVAGEPTCPEWRKAKKRREFIFAFIKISGLGLFVGSVAGFLGWLFFWLVSYSQY